MADETPSSPIDPDTSFTMEAEVVVERSDSGYATSDIDTSDTDSLASNTIDDRYTTVRALLRSEAGEKRVLQSITVETILSDKCGWGSLITGGQRAVDSLGQCLLVASTPHAENTRLSRSKPEFTLKSGSLKKNLEHCSILGRSTLRDVEKRMGDIKRTIRSANQENTRISSVIDQVENGEIDEGHLPPQLASFLQISADTVEHVDKMKEKVSGWTQYVTDVKAACEHALRRLNRTQKGKQAVVEESKTSEKQGEKQRRSTVTAPEEVSASVPAENAKVEEAAVNVTQKVKGDETASASIEETRPAIAAENRNIQVKSKFDSVLLQGLSPEEALSSARDVLAQATNFFSGNLGLSLHTAIHPLPPTEKKRLLRQSFSEHTLQNPSITVYEFMTDVEGIIHDIKNTLEDSNDTAESEKMQRVSALIEHLGRARDVTGKTPGYMKSEMIEAIDSVKETIGLLAATGKEMEILLPTKYEDREQLCELSKTIAAHTESIDKSVARYKFIRKDKAKADTETQTTMRPRSKSEVRNENIQLYISILRSKRDELMKKEKEEAKHEEEINAISQKLMTLGPDNITLVHTIDVLDRFANNLGNFQHHIEDLEHVFRSLQSAIDNLMCEAEINVANSLDNSNDLPPRHRRIEDIRIAFLKIMAYYQVINEAIGTYTNLSTRYIMPGVCTLGGYNSSMSKDKPTLNFNSVADNLVKLHDPYAVERATTVFEEFKRLRTDRLNQELEDLATLSNTKRFVPSFQLRREPSHISLDGDNLNFLETDELAIDPVLDTEEDSKQFESLVMPGKRFTDGKKIEMAALKSPERHQRMKIGGHRHRHSARRADVVVGTH